MAQDLEQAGDAVVVLGGAEQDGHDAAALQGGRSVLEDVVCRRDLFLEQGFKQRVVEVGQGFEQLRPRFRDPVLDAVRNLDLLGMLALDPLVGALADQIDEAGHRLAFLDGKLAHDQRLRRDVLQRLDGRAMLPAWVSICDEDDVRDVPSPRNFSSGLRVTAFSTPDSQTTTATSAIMDAR